MRILVHVSGGLDSAAVLTRIASLTSIDLGIAPELPVEVFPHFIAYGQAYAEQELEAAIYVIEHLKENLFSGPRIAPLFVSKLQLQIKSNTDVAAYTPHRNLVLAALSVNLAVARGCDYIAVGSKTLEYRPDDLYSFRDSGKPFFDALNVAIQIGTEPGKTAPQIIMPMAGRTKNEVFELLYHHDFNIDRLWSCYTDQKAPCGVCHHCMELKTVTAEHRAQALLDDVGSSYR